MILIQGGKVFKALGIAKTKCTLGPDSQLVQHFRTPKKEESSLSRQLREIYSAFYFRSIKT